MIIKALVFFQTFKDKKKAAVSNPFFFLTQTINEF